MQEDSWKPENHKGRNSADEVTISCIDPSAMTDGLFVGSAESLNYLLSKMWQARFFCLFVSYFSLLNYEIPSALFLIHVK